MDYCIVSEGRIRGFPSDVERVHALVPIALRVEHLGPVSRTHHGIRFWRGGRQFAETRLLRRFSEAYGSNGSEVLVYASLDLYLADLPSVRATVRIREVDRFIDPGLILREQTDSLTQSIAEFASRFGIQMGTSAPVGFIGLDASQRHFPDDPSREAALLLSEWLHGTESVEAEPVCGES